MANLSNIPAECELPQLHEIVDDKKLSDKIEYHLSITGSNITKITDCKINHLYYKPGGDCRLLLTANFQQPGNGSNVQQLFFGRVFQPGQAKKEFEYLRLEELSPPQYGPPAMLIPEWETVLWAFPNDPKLPGLSQLINTEKTLAAMRKSPQDFGLKMTPVSLTAMQTKYVPGRRCGFIYDAAFDKQNGNGAPEKFSVYGKAYQQEEGRKAYAIMKQIWESDAAQSGDLLLPQPYQFDEKQSIIWQEVVPGRPLAKIAGDLDNLPEIASEIGRRLAAFHNTQLDLPQLMTLNFQIEDLRFSVEKINQTFPEYADDCNAIAKKMYDAAERLEDCSLTLVHASFKFSHIFITNRGVVFIDFDNANLGDPGYDIGRFIAHLYKMKANGKVAAETAEAAVTNFCNAYNRAATQPLSQQRINWFAASHLIGSQVYKAVKRMNAKAVSKLLADARRLCYEE